MLLGWLHKFFFLKVVVQSWRSGKILALRRFCTIAHYDPVVWFLLLMGYGEFLPLHGFCVIAHVLPYYVCRNYAIRDRSGILCDWILYQRGNCVTNVIREMLHTCSRAVLRNIVIYHITVVVQLHHCGVSFTLWGFCVIGQRPPNARISPHRCNCAITKRKKNLGNCQKIVGRKNFVAEPHTPN